jgi:glycosyltransferase involved in cell wall biosynthesis
MSDIVPKKPKILYFITKSIWGGASRHVFDLATNLSPKNFDVTVVLGGNGILAKRLHECGIRTISLSSLDRDISAKKDLSSFVEFYKVLQNEKPDALHLHSTKAGGMGAFVARIYNLLHKHKIKIIFTVHGWPFNEQRSFVSKTLITFFSWLTVVLSHKVIVLGNYEKEQTKKWPLVEGKMVVIKNGIARPSYIARTKAREFLSTHTGKKISKETFIIGSVGELHANKGYTYIINALAALKKIPNCLYVILGEGEKRHELEALIKEKELKDRVFLLGYVHNAALYMKGFDVFAMPSIKEGLPYAIIEACKAEVPVIATHVGNIPEMIDDMQSGIVIKPENIREIEESIRFLLGHPDKRKSFAELAAKKINTEYSLSKMVDEVTKLYS